MKCSTELCSYLGLCPSACFCQQILAAWGGLTFQFGEISPFAQNVQVQTRPLRMGVHTFYMFFLLICMNSCSVWLPGVPSSFQEQDVLCTLVQQCL